MKNSSNPILDILERHAALVKSFISFQAAKNEFALNSSKDFSVEVRKLREAFDEFDAEIKNHMPFEEKIVADLFDPRSTSSILADHAGINSKVDAAKKLLQDESVNIGDVEANKHNIIAALSEVYNSVVQHYTIEDNLFRTKLKEIG